MFRQSELFKQAEGDSFTFTDSKFNYRNDLPPEAEENSRTLDYLLEVETDVSENFKLSPFLAQYIKYTRAVILQTICSKLPYLEEHTKLLKPKYERMQVDLLQTLEVLEHEEEIFATITEINEYWDVLDKGIYFEPGNHILEDFDWC